MKSFGEDLALCIVFTFYGLYNTEGVVELKLVRDCNFIVLSKCDFTSEN